MVDVRVEDKPSFVAVGRKTWISGQDNEQFGAFWAESNANGLIETLRRLGGDKPGLVTQAHVFGISCVGSDPSVREFDFYIAAEVGDDVAAGVATPARSSAATANPLDRIEVPACKWAIFTNRGELPMSLVEAEKHAFMEWLPASQYKHANAPELEVYPARDPESVEFWLPVIEGRGGG
jgi:AraC family transcriptional regulator